MKANPDLYKKLKDKKTKLGCTLGHCIKTGIDNPGKNFRYPLKERPLKERATPYWLRIRFIMKAPLKERSPEGTPQNQLLYRKAINYTLKNKK